MAHDVELEIKKKHSNDDDLGILYGDEGDTEEEKEEILEKIEEEPPFKPEGDDEE